MECLDREKNAAGRFGRMSRKAARKGRGQSIRWLKEAQEGDLPRAKRRSTGQKVSDMKQREFFYRTFVARMTRFFCCLPEK